jgi:hypothetical protein
MRLAVSLVTLLLVLSIIALGQGVQSSSNSVTEQCSKKTGPTLERRDVSPALRDERA